MDVDSDENVSDNRCDLSVNSKAVAETGVPETSVDDFRILMENVLAVTGHDLDPVLGEIQPDGADDRAEFDFMTFLDEPMFHSDPTLDSTIPAADSVYPTTMQELQGYMPSDVGVSHDIDFLPTTVDAALSQMDLSSLSFGPDISLEDSFGELSGDFAPPESGPEPYQATSFSPSPFYAPQSPPKGFQSPADHGHEDKQVRL